MISNIGLLNLMVRIVMEIQEKAITVTVHHKVTTVNVKKMIIIIQEYLRTCVMITMDLIVMEIILTEKKIGARIQIILFILLIADKVEYYFENKKIYKKTN